MADNSAGWQWVSKAALVAVAGLVYVGAQLTIDRGRAKLPALAYIECVQKLSTFDWAAHGITDHPSASEVCKERTGVK